MAGVTSKEWGFRIKNKEVRIKNRGWGLGDREIQNQKPNA
jgi:hypothetical protein